MQAIATLFATCNPAFFDHVGWMLRKQRDIALHPAAVSSSEALTVLRIRRFDALLLDAEPLGGQAIETLQSVATLVPGTPSLLFRSGYSDPFLIDVLRSGGAGCMPIDCQAADLARAIRAIHAGELWAPRGVVARAFKPLAAPLQACLAEDDGPHGQLSPREREIVGWMRTGMSNKEIARKLGISDMTVKTHAHNIFHKLEVSGRLRLFALR